MNKIYRKVWSIKHGAFVAAAETTRTRSKSSGGVAGALLTSVLLAGGVAQAQSIPTNTLPTGSQVTAGAAAISSIGNTMTVQQGTQRAAINWQTFSVGRDATVNFVQPNSSAILLNRVVGNERSVIDGAINANGQVWILNSSGVLFNGTAQVNVGGLVASTLNISDTDFMAGRNTFSANGSRASVINFGTINAADGGYVALLGNQVSNQGVISARLGTAALAAGDRVSLNFNGNSLVGVAIDQGTLNALVENKQAILSDGGMVVLTAKGLDTVLSSLVNNTGEIHARTIGNSEGKIYLLGDMDNGTVNVGGTLDASAPNGGNGGFVETSAAHVKVADSARVSTLAPAGQNGTWLIDPNDFTVAASGGDMTGMAVGTALAGGNFTIQSTSGAASGNGDIFVNDNISWTSGNALTLDAQRNIKINATIDASGGSGGVVNLYYGQGSPASGNTAIYDFGLTSSGFAGKINLQAGQNFNTKLGSDGTVTNWTVITQLGSPGDEYTGVANSLQGLAYSANLGGNFVLGADIDASATSTWNMGATGFRPIGSSVTPFSGKFDGIGHKIDHLTIHDPTDTFVGLFGNVGDGWLGNVGITNVDVIGTKAGSGQKIGALAGNLSGDGGSRIFSAYSTGALSTSTSGTNVYVGGLVGTSQNSLIENSFSDATVTLSPTGKNSIAGGLVGGLNNSTVHRSYASGTVSVQCGGYVGCNTDSLGGLVGWLISSATVSQSYATGDVVSSGNHMTLGGLVGYSFPAPSNLVTQSYATGGVSASAGYGYFGGLIGLNGGAITQSYATGSVTQNGDNTHADSIGGLVGQNDGSITNAYSVGHISVSNSPSGSNVGGLVGNNTGNTTNSFWDRQTTGMTVDGTGGTAVGKTTAEMKAVAIYSFTSPAWDIIVDSAVPSGNYPVLRWATNGASPGNSVWVIGQASGGGSEGGGGSSGGDSSGVEQAMASANNTGRTLSSPTSQLPGGGTRGDARNFSNVIDLPAGFGTPFGPDVAMAVISAPTGNEPNQVVSLSDAKIMLGEGDDDREVRVPVSRNSLAEIVNGGVRLPSGVEQQLFVVKGN